MNTPRSPRSRRRHLAAALGVAALGLAAFGCGDDESSVTVEPTTPTPPTTLAPPTTPVPAPPATPAPPPTTPAPIAPEPIVATTRDGRVVTIDPATGAELGELAAVGQLAAHASFADHRGTLARAAGGDIYVEIEILDDGGEPASRIYLLPAAGGAPELVAEGFAPAISPDESTFAYARGRYESEVVLRDLATGEERVIAARTEPPGEEFPDPIAALRFSPDGERLAVTWSYEGSMLATVDLAATSLHDAQQLFAAEPGCLSLGTWLGSGRLAAVVETSFPYCSNASEEVPGTGRVAVFEDDAEQTSASIALPTYARSLAADGETIAVVTFDDRLVRFDGVGAAPVTLGDGFTQIIW